MWTEILLLLPLFIFETSFGASIYPCPSETICTKEGGELTAKSFQFLNNLNSKYYRTVSKLTISNASLNKIPAEIKYFKNLTYLDLSYNNNVQLSSISSLSKLKALNLSGNYLKDVIIAVLPVSIEDLDISNNLFTHIPQDLSLLSSLKTLHLSNNPINCDCYNHNVLTYKKLINEGIKIPEIVTCNYPKHLTNQDINSINCTLNDIMLYDEPVEGSGSGINNNDIFNEEVTESKSIPHLHEQEHDEEEENDKNDYVDDKGELPTEDNDLIALNKTKDDALIVPEEGSGDGGEMEGSGIDIMEIPHIPACHVNCATPAPIGINDENDTLPLPGPTDQLKIVAEDVIKPIFPNSFLTTTTESPASSSALPAFTNPVVILSSTSSPPIIEEVSEEVLIKQVDVKQESSDKVEVFLNDTRTGEMEKATAAQTNNYTVFAVVACGLLLAVILLVCFVKKRKNNQIKRKHPTVPPSKLEKEMQPIDKVPAQKLNEKNGNMVNATPAEQAPLIVNGQNGKAKDDPVTETYTPLEHPEILTESEFADLRGFLQPNRGEKVTVRASENPDSIPKSPILVHRQVDGNGDVVTTVVNLPAK